jgi:hypothetical protein
MITEKPEWRAEKRGWTRRLVALCAFFALFALFTPNPLLTAAGIAVVPLLFHLLWRANEPPVLLFAVAMQWLQVFMPAVNANRNGNVFSDWAFQMAAWLGLGTIVVLAAGMRIGLGRTSLVDDQSLSDEARQLSVRRLAVAYVFTFFLGQMAVVATSFVPGLRQQFLALAALRWAVTFLIGWAALRDSKFRPLAFCVLLIELVVGFAGYFSAFKSVLFLAIVLIAAWHRGARRVLTPSLVFVVITTVVLASFWQSVKDEYRYFISEGDRAQVLRVPIVDRLVFLTEKAAEIRLTDLEYGFESALNRLGYIDLFSWTIQTVPTRVPFQHGRLWTEALTHVVTPRILFPNKAPINDSDRTREFTGIWTAGVEEGTSISIGYAGESYIDFGPVGMFVPIFLLGCFWGWAYRSLATRSRHKLLGIGVATNLILNGAIYFESSNIKLFGGAVSSLVVLWLLLGFIGDAMWRFVAPGPVRTANSRIQPPAAATFALPLEERRS